MAPAMQQPKSAVSAPLRWILKVRAIKGWSHSFRITCDMSGVSMLRGPRGPWLRGPLLEDCCIVDGRRGKGHVVGVFIWGYIGGGVL